MLKFFAPSYLAPSYLTPSYLAKATKLTLVAALLACSSSVFAKSWQASYTNSLWEASKPSQLSCELSHYIPEFGVATFIHRAGENIRLEVQPFRDALRGGQVQLVALAPQWQPGMSTQSFGAYNFVQTDLPLRLNTTQAELFIESLRQGLMPSMLQEDKDARIERRRASLSPVNFNAAFGEFQLCQARLLPVNYDQIRDITIGFGSGGALLTQADKDQLDLIVRYTQADAEVVLVKVDGHSDASGIRRDNRKLSHDRAQAVTDYLLARGMPEDKIQMQYHGQRYPIASNATAAGRSENRRVNIVLEQKLAIKPLF